MAEIRDVLDQIISERGKKADFQLKKEEELKQRRGGLRALEEINSIVKSLSPREQELLLGNGKSGQFLIENEKLVKDCIKAYEEAAEAAHILGERFGRETINIVVIGKIGTGKSTLLQSASGLGNDCIPALEGPSCTGVTSIIENVSGVGTRALLRFKTAEEALEDVNREIEKLANLIYSGKEKSTPRISKLDRADLEEIFLKLKEDAERRQEENTIKDLDIILNGYVNKAEELKTAYVDHWDDWYGYLDGVQERVLVTVKNGLKIYKDGSETEKEARTRYIVEEKDEIKTYISKQEYYRYLAVKEAVIQTNFSGIDARIRLIDTVGIGDASADTKLRMEEAIRDESDAVIFMLMGLQRIAEPANPEDIPVLTELMHIYHAYKDKAAADWMAFLINSYQAKEASPQYMKILQKDTSYGGNGMLGPGGIRFKRVIDVGDPESVRLMMSEFLQQIAERLYAIDKHLERESNLLCQKAKIYERILQERMKNIIICPENQRTLNFVSRSMRAKLKQLREEISGYCREIKEEHHSLMRERLELVRKLMDEENSNVLQESLDSMIDSCCMGNMGIAHTRIFAFKKLNRVVREIGNLPPVTQKVAEDAFKEKTARIFVDSLGIDLIKLEENGGCKVDPQDSNFFEKIGEFMLNDIEDTAEMIEAFYSINRFKLDDAIGITKTLFNYQAAKYLNPLSASSLQPYEKRQLAIEKESKNQNFNSWDQRDHEEIYESEESIDTPVKNFETARKLLKQEMKNKLNDFISAMDEIFDENNSERYLVDMGEQMKAELLNFLLFFDMEYEARWLMVFNKLYELGVIFQKESEQLKELSVKAQQIRAYFIEAGIAQSRNSDVESMANN